FADDPDGVFQYADSEHGSGPPARTRDLALLDDGDGNGADRLTAGRHRRRSNRRSHDGFRRRRDFDHSLRSVLEVAPANPPGSAPVDRGPADGGRAVRDYRAAVTAVAR